MQLVVEAFLAGPRPPPPPAPPPPAPPPAPAAVVNYSYLNSLLLSRLQATSFPPPPLTSLPLSLLFLFYI